MKNPEELPGGNVPRWTLGDRLRKARHTAGIKPSDMAEDIGVGERTISNYETDSTRVPKLVVKQYALRTGVPLEWLIGENFRPDGTKVDDSECYSVLEVPGCDWTDAEAAMYLPVAA